MSTIISQLKYTSRIILACLISVCIQSCESHEQKADEAFEDVKEEKALANKLDTNDKEIAPIEKKDAIAKDNVVVSEWDKFKWEMEKKIMSNELKIKEINKIPNTNSKLFKRIESLDKENNYLRREIKEYNEESIARWEDFKLKMKNAVTEISVELKDVTMQAVNDK